MASCRARRERAEEGERGRAVCEWLAEKKCECERASSRRATVSAISRLRRSRSATRAWFSTSLPAA